MGKNRGTGGKTVGITAILVILFIASPGWATTYKWVDEKGTINFTQDYDSIPEKYRDQIKEIPDKPGARPNIDEKPQKTWEKKPVQGLKGVPGREDAEKEPVNKLKIESGAAEALRIIVSLWKEENYGSLYEYGTDASKGSMSKEDFAHKMKNKKWGLAPSWETLQNMEAQYKHPKLVYVTAKIGYKTKRGGNVRFQTETYQMKLENGLWRANLSKILSAP
jgi:hypothetical protein